MQKLSSHQKKYLKGIAHGKKPVVTVGQKGLTVPLIDELRQSLAHHELIKVKLPAGEKSTRLTILEEICKQTDSSMITLIGRTGVIFKAAKESRITLPE